MDEPVEYTHVGNRGFSMCGMQDTTTISEAAAAKATDTADLCPKCLEAMQPPAGPPVNVDVPAVTGNSAAGSTLNCTMGNWENMNKDPHSYAYRWQKDGLDIDGAIVPDYTVSPTDMGHKLTCIVTATNELGKQEAPPSNEMEVL